jgi:hypothetical protein
MKSSERDHGGLESSDIQKAASAWLAYQSEPLQQNSWALNRVHELVLQDESSAWLVIRALCSATESNEVLCDIGAGPLEDAIYAFGDTLLDVIDKSGDAKILKAAACVWLKRDEELAAKLDAVLMGHGQPKL